MNAEQDMIVILKNTSYTLKPVEAYLSNRGLKIFSTHKLQEALAHIIKNKPNFVILSADHPNKKIKVLPKLINQAFKIPIIAFVESSNSNSMGALHEMSLEYKIFPPVSGPSIERILHKIKKDLETKANESEDEQQKISADGPDTGGNKSDVTMIQGSGTQEEQAAHSALQALISDMEIESDDPGAAGTPSGTIIQKGTAGEKIGYNPNSGESEPSNEVQMGNAGNYVSSWKPEDALKDKKGSVIMPESKARDQTPSIIQKGHGPGEKINPTFGNQDSIIVKGTQTALDESVLIRSPQQEGAEEASVQASHIACLSIESSQFSGYLVAALGKDQKVDKNFMTLVKERLFAFLRSHGEVIQEENDPMELKLEKVEFQDWARQHAEFLQKSIHRDDEIAVAFFPTEGKKMRVENSTHDDMVKLKLDDIREDTSVDFDVFVYLPENDKFILYTPEGNSLLNGQKQRLKTKGVTHLHLRKNDASEVRRYQARIFLSEKISEFKKQKRLNKASRGV